MEEKSAKILNDQRKALSHFLSIISSSTSADKLVNAFKLFLIYDGKVQKLMNQIIEHQKISKEIQRLNQDLCVVNNDIKDYVNNLNQIDCNLCNLMTDSSIYCPNSDDDDDESEQKQMFEVNDLIACAYNLRNGTAVKQINLSKNENIKQQMPIKYPVPQALTASKSILRSSAEQLSNEFLKKIKHEANDAQMHSSDDSDDDDDDIDNSDNEDDAGLEGFF